MQVSLVLAWCNSYLLQFSVRKWSFCVMSEVSRDLGASAETDKVGPDYFAFYTHEVAELLLQDEDFLPFSSQNSELAGRAYGVVGEKLFCNGIGARLSDFKKERLKAVLQQSVVALSQEVDEMLDPVLAIRRLQSSLKYKKSLSNYSAAACEGDAEHHPHKKIKLSSSSSSISIPLHASPISGRVGAEDSGTEGKDVHFPEKGLSNGVKKSCAHCQATESSKLITGPEGLESLCNTCVESKQGKELPSMNDQIKESCLVSNIEADNEYREVNDDLQFLLENDAEVVEESMKKYSDELSTTLGHMEQQIEELLDTVLSNCRLMTLSEKQQLRKLIQKLPPRNLDRVVEIIRRNKPPGKYSSGEVHVDLEKEDNVTLWRLYYYVEAVENARKLPG